MNTTIQEGLRILVVEDNRTILMAMGHLLHVAGHSVELVRRLDDALLIFQDSAFDLVISDINLADDSGLDLIRRIRLTSEVPAIAISGQGEMAGPSLESRFSAFLLKPISSQTLQQTIRQVVNPTIPSSLTAGHRA